MRAMSADSLSLASANPVQELETINENSNEEESWEDQSIPSRNKFIVDVGSPKQLHHSNFRSSHPMKEVFLLNLEALNFASHSHSSYADP